MRLSLEPAEISHAHAGFMRDTDLRRPFARRIKRRTSFADASRMSIVETHFFTHSCLSSAGLTLRSDYFNPTRTVE
jgi:hypothetical protein